MQILSHELLPTLNTITSEALKQQLFTACSLGVVLKNGDKFVLPTGRFTFEKNSPRVNEDSIFDVASITKVLPTASLALQAISESKLHLDDKVVDFIPELSNQYRDKIVIRHLFTQTLNFGFRMSEHKEKSPDEILKVIFNTPLKCPPGEIIFNSNATSILLGLVVERIYKENLDTLMEDRFCKPLEMTKTCFNPLSTFLSQEIVPSEFDTRWRNRLLQGEVHDEITFALGKKMVTGASGLFTTTPDLLSFVEMLLNNGKLHNKQFFSKHIVQEMQTNQTPNLSKSLGLGFDVGSRTQIGPYPSDSTISKTGFTGSIIIIDIKSEIGIVILTNHAYAQTTKDTTLNLDKMLDRFAPLNEFRQKIIKCLYESLR